MYIWFRRLTSLVSMSWLFCTIQVWQSMIEDHCFSFPLSVDLLLPTKQTWHFNTWEVVWLLSRDTTLSCYMRFRLDLQQKIIIYLLIMGSLPTFDRSLIILEFENKQQTNKQDWALQHLRGILQTQNNLARS